MVIHRVITHQHLGSLLDRQVLSVGDVSLGAVTALTGFVTRVGVGAGHHTFLLLLLTAQIVLLV